MPFLIRIIIQRILVAFISLLVFLGLAPESDVSGTNVAFNNNPEFISEFLNEQKENIDPNKIIDIINDAAKNIEEKRSLIVGGTSVNEDYDQITVRNSDNNSSGILNNTTGNQNTDNITRDDSIYELVVDLSRSQFNTLEDVVVNIICTHKQTGFTTATAGSGVIVSPQGIVMTNAHVAQFFLLEDSETANIDCGIYRENIPTFGYKADILYLPPNWILNNYKEINSPAPRGTGEEDYALLLITENTNPVLSLPNKFSFTKIGLDESVYKIHNPISIAGFPGAPKSLLDLAQAGNFMKDNSTITEIYTLRDNDIDVFSTGISNVAARGASGGGVFYGKDFIGMTVTTSQKDGGSVINALTTTYINNDIKKKLGKNILDLISNNPYQQVKNYKKTELPALAEMLKSEMK